MAYPVLQTTRGCPASGPWKRTLVGILLFLGAGCGGRAPHTGDGSSPVAGAAGTLSSGGAAAGTPATGGSGAGQLGVPGGAGAAAGSPSTSGAGAGGTATMGGRAGSAGGAGFATSGAAGAVAVGRLVHPGGFFTQPDLDRIRSSVASGAAPWSVAWNAIRTSDAQANYQPNVTATITDQYALQNQGHAAYVLAIKWVASGDEAYATAAIRILDAWVDTVTSMTTTTLRTGIGAVQMANAAEIMAHGFGGSAGWPPAQVAKAKAWFGTVPWSRIGSANLQRSSNWGTSAMAGCMATAIFADDMAKFNYTVDAYKNGFKDAPDGCSGVTQYICNESGQATEAGRDQGHPQGGVGHLVEVAFMAWNQGVNLVSHGDNRVVAGMEYLAKYNLGGTVPYDANFPDPCNVHPSWSVISELDRGKFSPVYEMAGKLFTLARMAHPFTQQVIASAGYTPEKTNSDHAGLGTLTLR